MAEDGGCVGQWPEAFCSMKDKEMFDKILLPLDGSQLSEQSLPMVQDLAIRYGATVHLIRVVQSDSEEDDIRESVNYRLAEMEKESALRVAEARQERATIYLEKIRSRLAEAGVKVDDSVNIERGEPSSKIVEYAESNGIGLIAMSTHGYGGLKRLLVGSVADKVARSCDVPLLLKPCR